MCLCTTGLCEHVIQSHLWGLLSCHSYFLHFIKAAVESSFMLSSIIYLVSAFDYFEVRIHSTLWLHHKLCCDLILCINLQEPVCGYVDTL